MKRLAFRPIKVGFLGFMLLAWVLLSFPSSSSVQQWAKVYGGRYDDVVTSIQQTRDGGYIVAGNTLSFGAGYYDFWVLKLDANGNVVWQKAYGGNSVDAAYSIQQTSDGGYIVAGKTSSFDAGFSDFWVLKLDAKGNVIWQKRYGGSGWDEARSIQQTSDGGYIVAGKTSSFGAGESDFWVLKLDRSGNVQWQKTYGGSDWDGAFSIQQTQDGGYIVAGSSRSFGAGFWVLKLDANGNVEWQKTYGESEWDVAYSIKQTQDGGYIVGGRTVSFGVGGFDALVLKLDVNGNIADCPILSTSSAKVNDTRVVGFYITASINSTNTSAITNNTSAIVKTTTANITQICHRR